MSRKLWRLAVLLLALTLLAGACGHADGASTELSGSIDISGSSTVEPISARNAEKFSALHPGVAMTVEGPGTGDGAKLFCGGDIDIGDASRSYKDSERETCAANGIEFVELVIATDGITVLTSTENDTYTCLATSDLYALLGPESQGTALWSDNNDLAAELGAPNAPYPDERLDITAPGEESGTFDTFVEFLIEGAGGGEHYAETRGADSVRPDYVASANDNVIIEGVAGSPYSLGWVGYSFYLANQGRVKALEIDAGDGCIAPRAETIAGYEYPFARPLFIYVNLEAAASKPEVAAFVDFYLSEAGLESIDDAGYIRLADYGDTLAAWQGR